MYNKINFQKINNLSPFFKMKKTKNKDKKYYEEKHIIKTRTQNQKELNSLLKKKRGNSQKNESNNSSGKKNTQIITNKETPKKISQTQHIKKEKVIKISPKEKNPKKIKIKENIVKIIEKQNPNIINIKEEKEKYNEKEEEEESSSNSDIRDGKNIKKYKNFDFYQIVKYLQRICLYLDKCNKEGKAAHFSVDEKNDFLELMNFLNNKVFDDIIKFLVTTNIGNYINFINKNTNIKSFKEITQKFIDNSSQKISIQLYVENIVNINDV